MNHRLLIGLLLIPALCANAPSAISKPAGVNFISGLKGKVEIKRSNLKKYQKANFGDVLNAGDRIRVPKGAMATITCSNLKNWSVPVGKESQLQDGCRGSDRTVLTRQDRKTGPTRSGDNPTLPYLLSPRNTTLLDRQPMLRWNNINASPYKVTVSGGEVNWSKTVDQPQVLFPGNQQPIEPGFRYRVTVVAQDGQKTAPDDPVSFAFLSDEQVKQVRKDAQRVKQLQLDPAVETLTIALLYQSYDLNAEAIVLLEDAIAKGLQTTATSQLLGELYQQSELPRFAKEQYGNALKQAQAEDNPEGQAILQTRLGEVYEALDNLKEALRSFQAAQSHYQTLDDLAQVKSLQAKIDDLSKRMPHE